MSTIEKLARRGAKKDNETRGKVVDRLPAATRDVRPVVGRTFVPVPPEADELSAAQEATLERFDGMVPQRVKLKVIHELSVTAHVTAGTECNVATVTPTGVILVGQADGREVADAEFEVVDWAKLLDVYAGRGPQVMPTPMGEDDEETAAAIDPSEPGNETFLEKREAKPADGETPGPTSTPLAPGQVPVTVKLISDDFTILKQGEIYHVQRFWVPDFTADVWGPDGKRFSVNFGDYEPLLRVLGSSDQGKAILAGLPPSARPAAEASPQPSDRGSDAAGKGKGRGRGSKSTGNQIIDEALDRIATKVSGVADAAEKSVTKQVNENPKAGSKNGYQKGNRNSAATAEGESRAAADRGSAAAAGPDVVLADLPTITLTLDELVRHPANRRPSQASIDARAESLREQGQLEPIVVRIPIGPHDGEVRYQILSGETRWLAAKKLGWPTIAAKVLPSCDDAQAFVYLAEFNAQRAELNAIEKAELIETLCKPVADGGGGLTREAAAKRVGLATGAAASNLVRLLLLPPKWRERVASGELRQTIARRLTDFAAAPAMMQAFEKSWLECHKPKADEYDRDSWESDVAFQENTVDEVMRDVVRLDEAEHYSSYEIAGNWNLPNGKYKPLFELNDENRKKIEVAVITIDGKPVEVATNKKEFMKLQKPLVKKAMEKGSKSKASKAADDDDRKAAAKPKPKTAAEQRAAAKLQAEQLEARIAGWRHKWLKAICCGDRPMPADERDRILKRFLGALLLSDESNIGRVLSDALEEAFRLAGAKLPKYGLGIAEAWNTCTEFGPGLVDLLWAGLHGLLSHEDRDVRYPLLPFAFVDRLAETLKVDVAKEWEAMQREPKKPRLEEFLLLHNNAQLDALAEELGVYVADAGQKSIKVARFLGTSKSLKLPKAVAPLAKPKATKGKRGGK